MALQIDDARNRRDVAALKSVAAELADQVRPETSADLKESAGQLAASAKSLVQLSEQLGRLAEQRQSDGLRSLAKYAASRSANVETAAKLLENPAAAAGKSPSPSAAPQSTGDELDQFTDQYAALAAEVSRLLEDLGYFATLGALAFPRPTGAAVREAILLRNVSRWARGEEVDDVSRATRLFDWTVRNIQLEPDRPDPASPHFMKRPSETLIFGTGTALERAWVFILLARQQGLDAVMLAVDDAAAGEAPALGSARGPSRFLARRNFTCSTRSWAFRSPARGRSSSTSRANWTCGRRRWPRCSTIRRCSGNWTSTPRGRTGSRRRT